jgi:hypothetical protein
MTRCNTSFGIRSEKILKATPDKNGYLQVTLFDNQGKRCHLLVHRLVAKLFIGNDSEGKEIDHIDGNRKNNMALNLRWCSHRENMRNELTRKKLKSHVCELAHRKRSVICYTKEGAYVGFFHTITDASKKTGAYRQNISRCCKGKMKMVSGLIFNYCDYGTTPAL